MNPTLARVLLVLMLPAFYLVPRVTGSGWGAVVGQLAVVAAAAYPAIVSLRASIRTTAIQSRGPGRLALRRWRVPDRQPVGEAGPYEGPDPVGDNYRVVVGATYASVFGVVTLVSLVLLVVGDSQLKGLAVLGLSVGVFMAISMGVLLRNAVRRIARGRGRVPGDPLRPEGIDPIEGG